MIIYFLYKSIRIFREKISHIFDIIACWWLFKGNNVHIKNFNTHGIPYIMVARGGKMSIGKNFMMNNGMKGNPIGCFNKCTFFVDRNATLKIGNNVGISQTALIAIEEINIGNNVKIGGGSYLYTSDFHSLDPIIRNSKEDLVKRKSAPIILEDNVFIGAHSIILKGVHIGKNSIIGAGSIVTKSIPANQIWAGNPARFIKNI